MKNQSVSDFVAAAMDAVLNSPEHKSMFGTQYKFAQDANAAKESMCAKHSKMDTCEADDKDSSADANDAKDSGKSTKEEEKSTKADTSSADDDDNDAKDSDKSTEKDDTDKDAADDLEASAAFDVAIDSLLTASAALDSVGLGRGSAHILKIASLVVEAKKKDKKDKKSKKDEKSTKKTDTQAAKDKKSDSKKKFPFKKDEKSTKKTDPKKTDKKTTK